MASLVASDELCQGIYTGLGTVDWDTIGIEPIALGAVQGSSSTYGCDPSCNAMDEFRRSIGAFHGSLCNDAQAALEMLRAQESNNDQGSTVGMHPRVNTNDLSDLLSTKGFELKYIKPAGFDLISRKAFPTGNSKKEWDRVVAANCGDWEPVNQQRYKAYATSLKNSMAKTIKSKLFLHLTSAARRTTMTLQGKQVQTLEDVFKSWSTEQVTPTKCSQLFFILYGSLEIENAFAKIQIETLLEHGVFFSTDDKPVNRVRVGGDVVYSCVWQMTKDKLRDSYRNRYTRASLVPHGVRVNVTEKYRTVRSKRNNRKGEFIFDENVKGWMEDKHLSYLEQFKKRSIDDDGVKENTSKKVK